MTAALAPSRFLGPAAVALVCVVIGLVAGINPALAIAGALGAILVLVLLADLSAGLALFVLVTFLGVLPIAGGPAVSAAKAAGLLLVLSWLATIATREDTRRDLFSAHPALSYLLLLFVAWCLLSQLWASDPEQARLEASRYALNLALIPIVFTAVRTPRHVVWVAGAFVAGSTISALYGMVSRPAEATEDLNRLAGTIGDPNQLATVLIAGAILSLGLAAALNRPTQAPGRALAVGASALCLIAALSTLSRGGLLALALLPVAILAFGGRWRKTGLAIWAVAAVAAGAYFVSFAPEEARERIVQADGGSGRTEIWTVGWRMVEDKPLAGVGAGNFQNSSIDYLLEPGSIQHGEFFIDDPKVAHNMYLDTLAGLGIVGLAVFLAIIGISIRCAFLAARRFAEADERGLELLARAFLIALIAVLLADFFVSDQLSKQLWLLIAMGPALLAVANSGSYGREAEPRPAFDPAAS